MKSSLKRMLMTGTLMTAMTFSCTNLDEELFSEVTPDNFFKTEEEFVAALGAAYTSLYGFAGHNGIFSVNEVSSDEMAIPVKGQDWADGYQWVRMHRHQYLPTEESFNNTWSFCYGIINNCNRLIEQFETIEGSDAIVAELKVLRAMSYYWLLDMFGNVPIVTSFANSEGNPTNAPRSQVFNFVKTEIEANVDKLSKNVDQSTYGRVNYYVGQAILAKLNLNAQVYTGTAQWDAAIAACDLIINSNKYQLESNYYANFRTQNSGSKENIMVIPYDQVFAQGFNLPMMTLHYGSQATYNLTQQPWNGYCTLQEFYNSYENGDARKANFIAGPQFTSSGAPVVDNGAEPGDPDGQPLNYTPAVNQLEPNALRQAGARVGKFEFALGATNNLSNDYPLFRYGDILLVKAEAVWRKGGKNPNDAAALALVNQVRRRSIQGADFTTLTDANFLAERGREMFAEATRRQDLIRFGKYNDAWWEKPASQAFRNIFPIPAPQRNANPALTQNPGY